MYTSKQKTLSWEKKKKKKIHLVILTLSCPVRGFHFLTLAPMSPYHAIHKHLDVCKRKS